MQRIQRLILDFTKDTGLTERREMVHGTLYVKLHEEKECDTFHKVLRTFFKEQIDNEGGVNMYAVGDEFAFDFVPEDREAPVFTDGDEEEKGVWSDFAEEGLAEDFGDELEAEAEIQMQLDQDAKEGR